MSIQTMATIGDSITWGIHTGPVTRILIDEQGNVHYEFEHDVTLRDQGGIPAKRKTWVRESECQQHRSA